MDVGDALLRLYVDAMRAAVAGWAGRIARGDGLGDLEAEAFATWLAACELAGRPLLGSYAGADASIDTVSGRCGTPPPGLDARRRRLMAAQQAVGGN